MSERTLEDDVKLLEQLGQTTEKEWAERTGCTRNDARGQLRRLVKEGYAEYFKSKRVYIFVKRHADGATNQTSEREKR
jgi:Fic family protein